MGAQETFAFRVAVAAAVSMTAWTAPAVAQEEFAVATGEGARALPDCLFRLEPASDGSPPTLIGNCRGRGVILGPTDEYKIVRNESLGATVVDLQFAGKRRVLMLTLQDDGQVLVEDLGGQIALAAGRGPLSDIAGLTIELEGFAEDGGLAVRPGPDDSSRQVAQLNLGQQIAAERGRRLGSAASN